MNATRLHAVFGKLACAALAAALACCALAGCSTATSNTSTADANTATKYTLYIGTNSQTTGSPTMSYEKAKELVISLALKYEDGYTLYDAQGGWTNDAGEAVSEDSIVLSVVTDDSEGVHKIAAEAAKALDQTAILIETSPVTSEFYAAE